MTKGDIMTHVIRMALPMTIGIGAIISFSLADTYFIGQLGATELAAIGYTFPVTTMLFNIVFGMAIAMSAVVSRTMGQGDREKVGQIIVVGVAIALLQALTQIQEMTLVFVPKILAMFLALFVFLPSMMKALVVFMEALADRMIGLG